jgi:poly(A) polymerase
MRLPSAAWRERPQLAELIVILGAEARQVRVVGGAVRDTLLGLAVSDLDLATVHPPDEVMRRVAGAGLKAVPTGLAHGTVTVVLPDGPVEVTTLRRDVATDGRHAQVMFTDDWREDAARRDFTINALSADLLTGEIHDYFSGQDDLTARRVRFIGDPLRRIAEDHLRILRFFRFHARFGRGEPDADALAACTLRANDLLALSRERIAQELLKLLAAADPSPVLATMVAHAILAPVLPEIDAAGVERLGRLVARDDGDPVRRLAALLPADPARADAVAVRLKLSNAQRKRLGLAAHTELPSDVRALAYAIGVAGGRDRVLLRAEDKAMPAALAALEGWSPPRLPITGGTLIELGLIPGPDVARTLQQVEHEWVAEGFPDEVRVRQLASDAVDQQLRARK